MRDDYTPILREDHRPRLDRHYVFGRYICPTCDERYGEPLPSGLMEIRRCDSCPKFNMDKINISKRRLKCNLELMQYEQGLEASQQTN